MGDSIPDPPAVAPSTREAAPPSRLQPDTRPPVKITQNITLQAPLSRAGKGPGLVLVVDHYAEIGDGEGCLDPGPMVKWAEEGFAVVVVAVPGKEWDGGEFPLGRAVEALKGCEGCEFENGFGLISYLNRIPFYVEEAVCLFPSIKGVVSYGGRKFTSISPEAKAHPPQLIHIAGPETPRRASMSIVPSQSPPPTATESPVKSYRYLTAQKDSSWILPSDPSYHPQSAHLAHTRSLQFLKPLLNGPYFDLEAVWDEHCLYEFELRDVEKTMATMVSRPYVNHIPTMTGGIGKERLTAFYTNHFIHSNPPDTSLDLVSRTVGIDRVIDEFVFKLTHDRVVEWLLPGLPPTGKYLEIPFTSIVAMRGDRLCHEHISWDQGTALRQAGVLPEWVAFPYQIDGRGPEAGKKFEVRLPVAGVECSRKLVDEGCVESNGLMGKGWREVDDE